MSKWITVDEKFPTHNRYVLATILSAQSLPPGELRVVFARFDFDDDRWHMRINNEDLVGDFLVVAWREIPKPYDGSKKKCKCKYCKESPIGGNSYE